MTLTHTILSIFRFKMVLCIIIYLWFAIKFDFRVVPNVQCEHWALILTLDET